MKYHGVNDCLRVATAIKKQVDYLLFAIGNKEDKDCEYHLDRIRQLTKQLRGEVSNDSGN